MVVFQKLKGKTTTLNFWNQKLEGKTTTLKNWIKKMEGNSTTPKNCVLSNFLHERSMIFLLVFSLIRFWILLRNGFSFQFLISKHQGSGFSFQFFISKFQGSGFSFQFLKNYHDLTIFYSDFEFFSGMLLPQK